MPKIVYVAKDPNYVPLWFHNLFAGHDIAVYDKDIDYNPKHTVFYHNLYSDCDNLLPMHIAQGFRIIYDAKNEHYIPLKQAKVITGNLNYRPLQTLVVISGQTAIDLPNIKVVATPYWYWYLDQNSWIAQGIDHWQRSPDPMYDFFMQISLSRDDRSYFYDSLLDQGLLERSLHSFRARNKFLPNDVDPSTYQGNWQRYVNKQWYDQTCFSVVVETYLDGIGDEVSFTYDDNVFLSEKTYKAMACQHPFILASTQHNLSYVRSQGFETFPELFDESYDHERLFIDRVNKIANGIRSFARDQTSSYRVQEKIRYNHARFFNKAVIHKLIHQTFVIPVLEFVYAET